MLPTSDASARSTATTRAAAAPASADLTSHALEALVVGAGAAGLASAAELSRKGVEVAVLERAGAVAASWRERYDDLQIVTDRWTSSLPGYRIPPSAGRWPSRDDLIRYLERYRERFRLDVRLGVEVDRVDRVGDWWDLSTTAGSFTARSVVIATGHDRVPFTPSWPGAQDFGGQLLHSARYRNPRSFAGQRVLVVGAGNSGGLRAATGMSSERP